MGFYLRYHDTTRGYVNQGWITILHPTREDAMRELVRLRSRFDPNQSSFEVVQEDRLALAGGNPFALRPERFDGAVTDECLITEVEHG